jgi:phage anti-repressor protein
MNFRNFLKKYSPVNIQFIDDFNEIISEDLFDKYREFLIDSETLRKWLQLKIKKDFDAIIKKTYNLGVDYIKKNIKSTNNSGGSNRIVYMLTPETAKKICLVTKSKLGNNIRQYFIDIELTLYKYQNYIIDGLNNKIKQLENNQKPKVNANKKLIYIFKALNTEVTLYKVGKTINSKKRFNSHNSPLANDIELLYIYETENIDQVEACAKNKMKKYSYRKYKEIYQVNLGIIKTIIKDCDKEIRHVDNMVANQKGGKVSNKDIL